MRISDWSSDVCSSDLLAAAGFPDVLRVRSRAGDRATYLRRPDLGRRLDPDCVRTLQGVPGAFDIAFLVADGLSARAVQRHAAPLLSAVRERQPRSEELRAWNECGRTGSSRLSP